MKNILLLVVISVLLAQPVFAYTYLNIYIDSSGSAEFFGETNETNLLLPSGISLQEGKIRGTTQQLTTKLGELWTFSYSLKGAEIKAILPEGASIKNISTGEIFLERDRISIFYQDSLTVKYVINETQSSNLWITLLVVIVVLAIILIYFFRTKILSFIRPKIKPKVIYKRPKQKETRLEVLKQVLNARENLILEKLKETGKVKMSHLRKLCGIPKASFSRHVQELEKKKLLSRSGQGKNKFVELVKNK